MRPALLNWTPSAAAFAGMTENLNLLRGCLGVVQLATGEKDIDLAR